MSDADPEMSDQEIRASARIGTTLKGKYRIDRVLGIGGMAVVYAATHRNQAEFAVKMLHPELSFHKDVCSRFLREGYAANSVKHPGVVMVVDDDTAEDGAAFLVMELLRGDGVEALWEKAQLRMSPRVAVGIVDQLLDVLTAAHEKGIVHRDIKPANLFLTHEGVMKVLDFGIARARDALASSGSNQTGTGMVLGTPSFMAPEQALAKSSEIDAQTDVWAAGATLFSLISGEFVHTGDNVQQLLVNAATKPARSLSTVASSVPPEIVDVVARAIAFDKSARFISAKAMQIALREACMKVYGGVPTREWLATGRHEVATAATEPPPKMSSAPFQSTPNLPPLPSGSNPGTIPLLGGRPLGAITVQPVSGNAPSSAIAPPKSRSSTALLISLIALLVTGVAIFFGVKTIHAHVAATPEAVPSSSMIAASASVVLPPSSPSANAVAASSATAPRASTVASASSVAPVHAPAPNDTHRGRGHASPPASTTSAAAPPAATTKPIAKPSCDPPFFFDAQGRKIFKPECM